MTATLTPDAMTAWLAICSFSAVFYADDSHPWGP